MKRIIFCFDGTSNDIDSDEATNVLLLSASLKNQDKNTPQIIYYEEGVGTVPGREIRDGATGKGLYSKIKEAYEFLCFNYVPGDEIFVFGFSRGAYTARSFCGFIHFNGIMKRAKIETVINADKSYKTRNTLTESRDDRFSRYDDRYRTAVPVCCGVEEQYYRIMRTGETNTSPENFPLIKIKYLGVWDTVKTLTHGDEKDHDFHIDEIVEIIESSRHAIAIDEYRKEFDVTPFYNLDAANERSFSALESPEINFTNYLVSNKRKHQEKWFPGNHGSVGGGGDIRGLSDGAYQWVLEGAKKAGLKLDVTDISKIFNIQPDPRAPLDNTSRKSLMETAWKLKTKIDDHQRMGPRGIHEVDNSTILRVAYSKYDKETDEIYNPGPLKHVWSEIEAQADQYSAEDFELALGYSEHSFKIGDIRSVKGREYYIYRILPGELLGTIAQHWLGNRQLYKEILKANKVMIPDEDNYQAGQFINLPMNDFLRNQLNEDV